MKKNSGFTLVELLVVIGIIALLISILLPALSKARQQANTISCLSNLHSMAIAMTMYENIHKGIMPYSDRLTTPPPGTGDDTHWGSLLAQVVGIGSGTIASAGNSSQLSSRNMFICKDSNNNGTGSIALNTYSAHPLLMPDLTLNYPNVAAWGALANQPRQPYRVNRITNPVDIVLIFDAVQCTTNNQSLPDGRALDLQRVSNTSNAPVTYLLKGYCNQNGVDLSQSVDGGPNTDDSTTNFNDHIYGNIRWRHNGNKAANFLYVDGHAGTLGYTSELRTGLLRRNVCVDMP